MPIQSGFAGIFEGWTRLELIQKVLRGLHQTVASPGTSTDSDFNRYPKQDIVDKLIEGQVEFVSRTDSLTTFEIVETKAGIAEYNYPSDALKILSAQWYSAVSRYEELIIISDKQQMKRISVTYKTDAAGQLEYLYPSYNQGNVRKFGTYPKPSSDGTFFTASPEFGATTLITDFTTNGNLTGTHRVGAGDDTAFLEDEDGRDFTTLGVTVGMMIFNTLDGSSGQITGISNGNATNDRLAVTLSGGTDDDFDEGDAFIVPVGEYGVVIDTTSDEDLIFDGDFGAISDISSLDGNILIDYVKRPLDLDSDTQFPEIPMDYQQALVEYAIWKLGGTEYDGFVAEKRSSQGEVEWLSYVERYNAIGDLVVEADNQVEDREGLLFHGNMGDSLDGRR